MVINLQPSELVLTGEWVFENGRMRGDAVEDRIEALIAEHLRFIANSPQWGAWEVLYQDPNDGRYWELTYPQGEMQGGGPRQLEQISSEIAAKKYIQLHPQVQP